MNLTINEQSYEVADEPDRPFLWVIRDELGLTGTRFGCGAGICGACTIHLDGQATRSCTTPLSAVSGKSIRTIEGLADASSGVLHPVQAAFIEQQVPQCGWCMSGQIMTASAFLEQNESPSEADMMSAMSNNYCRCGCYVRIRRAVIQAAEVMNA